MITFEDGDPDVQAFLKKVMKIEREHILTQKDETSSARRDAIKRAALEVVRQREAKPK